MDRTGLYIIVLIILFFGPCGMDSNNKEIIDRLDRIEIMLEKR